MQLDLFWEAFVDFIWNSTVDMSLSLAYSTDFALRDCSGVYQVQLGQMPEPVK